MEQTSQSSDVLIWVMLVSVYLFYAFVVALVLGIAGFVVIDFRNKRLGKKKNRLKLFFKMLIPSGILIGLVLIALPIMVFTFAKNSPDKCRVAQSRLNALRISVLLFREEKGRLPTKEEGVKILVDEKYLIPEFAEDPWGNELVYILTKTEDGQEGFEVLSTGPDERKGGGDDVILDGCQAQY